MLEFIQENPSCFERTSEKGHITASSWLLNSTGNKALLLHHAKLDIWCQPGGHCDGDSNVLGCALREAREETGVLDIAVVKKEIFDIDIHKIPKKGAVKEHLHYDIRFLLQIASKEPLMINEESKGYVWIEKNIQLCPTKERSILRMVQKWIDLL
jgi:8-oxo-dGTP pyrophosphatase MutT (NUDIX family)